MIKLKFIAIAFFLLFFAGAIPAQEQVNISDIEIINLGDGQVYAHLRDADKTAINGKVRIITGFTTEYIDAFFDKGLATGRWEYYKNNKLSSYMNYENGYLDGEAADLKADGSLNQKAHYRQGKKDGDFIDYYSDGEIKQTETYKDDSLIKRVTFFTNGDLESEKNFLEGKQHGTERKYSYEGDLKTEKNYKNGKQVGRQFQYYSSNRADYTEVSHYNENGRKDGEYVETYAENNNIKVKGQYKNDKKDGKWIYCNLDGEISKEELYDNGKLLETKR